MNHLHLFRSGASARSGAGRRWSLAVVFVAVMALLVTGCGSGSSSEDQDSQGSGPGSLLPESVKKQGVLTFATDMTYPPFEFLAEDNKTPKGFDIDLGRAVADELGMKAEFRQVKFDAIPTELQSRRTLLAISAFTDTKERENVADFVNYLKIFGVVLYRPEDGAPLAMADLCGRTVGLQAGVEQARTLAESQSRTCTEDGQPAIEMNTYPDAPAQALALRSGRVDAIIMDSAVGGYLASQSNGKIAVNPSEKVLDTTLDGIAVAKGNPEVTAAVKAALESLIENGSYLTLLKKWGLQDGAVSEVVVNVPSDS